jgi:hypothetical protein
MPANLYGPGGSLPEYGHVVAALIRRFHEAKVNELPEVVVWGTGTPLKFLYVDELADACVHLMKHYSGEESVNIGTGNDITIAELAQAIARAVGYDGRILFDHSKPDGTPRKLLDVRRLSELGWSAKLSFEDGIHLACQAYLDSCADPASGNLRKTCDNGKSIVALISSRTLSWVPYERRQEAGLISFWWEIPGALLISLWTGATADIQRQLSTKFSFAQKCPTRHYARKNIGYLVAIDHGQTDRRDRRRQFPTRGIFKDGSLEVDCPRNGPKGG